MKKEDLTVVALFAESIGFLLLIGYLGLQIYYGVMFHVEASKLIINLCLAVLVYVGLTILSNYPERVNGLHQELCVGKIRKWTLRMLRIEKLVFIISLMIPCICDATGNRIDDAYSLLVILVLGLTAFYFEYRIWKEIRSNRKDK